MGVTLISISWIAEAGSTVVFAGKFCRIYNQDKEKIGEIKVKGGLYRVYYSPSGIGGYSAQANETLTVDQLHQRLGHVSHGRAKFLVKKGLIEGIELMPGDEMKVCESCESSKGNRKAMIKIREGGICPAIGDEIHSDLWGKAPVESINHKLYYISFTDDHSRFTKIYFLYTRDESYESYRSYEAWLSTQKNAKIKCLCTDRGGEYLGNEFSAHLRSAGTIRRLTVHDTPEHNGVSERLNRTIMEKVHAMLHDSGLPKFLWAEAVAHAVYIKNRTWTRTIGNTTPYEIMYGQKPNLANLQPWGCKVRVHRPVESKLEGRSQIGRWMGFDEETKDGHRIYWPEKRKVSVERNVRFNFEPEEVIVGSLLLEGEDEDSKRLAAIEPETTDQHNQLNPSMTTDSGNFQIETENRPISPENDPIEAEVTEGRGRRIRRETEYVRLLRTGSAVTGYRKEILPKGMQHGAPKEPAPDVDHAMATVIESAQGLTPKYAEARRRPDWPRWEEAIKKELRGLETSGTWCLVERPPNANVVDSKWVLRIKKNAAGEIDKYKARLVARGFTQIYRVDYYETYSPVARLASFRLLMAIAARNGWTLNNFDFDQAFLNSILGDDEVIYMEQPPDYQTKDRREWVWRLLRSLYGLKQGSKNWYDTLHKAMLELGFTRSEADYGVFFKRVGKDVIIVAVHVDDGMVTGNNVSLIKRFKEDINEKYKITDLGPVYSLLGIKVTRDLANKTISLSQQAYVEAIVTKFNFDDLKPSAIPMDPSAPLSKSQSPTLLDDIAKMRNVPYREAVGSLMYAAMGTRPDIAFATSTVAQYSENPGWKHWEAVKRIFRYLSGTRNLQLTYGGEERGLIGYVDADGASQDHRRAISGYVFMVDGEAVPRSKN
jgi:Reverse transcriptase (RNA-dependent DNA polymerase)/GAG-pre-integrase domain